MSRPTRPGRRLLRAAGLALAGTVLATAAHAGCAVETLELPVKLTGSRVVATVGINGTPVPLAVDSGAFFSFLAEAAAAQLHLPLRRNFGLRVSGLTGMDDVFTTRVDKLTFLKGEIPRVDFIVNGNEPGDGTMGLLGRNLLSFTDTEYDLAHGVIRLLFPSADCAKANMAYWAGSSPVSQVELLDDPQDRKTPAIRAQARLNGRELVALFDTGAPTTLLSTSAARRASGGDIALEPIAKVRGGDGGSALLVSTAPFETLEIGNEVIRRNRLHVADFNLEAADLLVGLDFFLSHRIYVSKQQSKMFLTYNGGPVFALDGAETSGVKALPEADPSPGDAPSATAGRLARRAAAAAARHDFKSALGDLDRACALDPSSAEWLAQRGAVHEAMDRPELALADDDQALALDPSQAETRFRRALLRFAAKNLDGAQSDLDTLDKTLAPQAQLRLAMANLYDRLEQPSRVLAQVNQWLAVRPHDAGRPDALNTRCWNRMLLGIELKEALDDCNDAVDGDSKNPQFLDSRGWLQLRLGSDRKALADFDRVVRLDPEHVWSLFGRGLAKKRLGDAPGGEADIATARRLRPDIDSKVARTGLPI